MSDASLDAVFRDEWPRVVGALVRGFGDVELAEDAAQDAFEIAARSWPVEGMPPNPGGWITTTARRRAIDRLRREAQRNSKHHEAQQFAGVNEADLSPTDVVATSLDDDVLRLIFTCCHPALDADARVALTLRLVSGLRTEEIARAFLVPPTTLAQRLVRAKRKIRAARVPFRIPSDAELPDRLAPVLAVILLVFNEGYLSSGGDSFDRPELCEEAIRLGRLLAGLMPDEPEVKGLLAWMLLVHARRPARFADDGSLVPLAEQDRGLWDRRLMGEGREILRRCLRMGRPGPYQLHAAINAVHADAADVNETDWRQVLTLYDHLMVIAPTPVVELNRAVAIAEVSGPRRALGLVEQLDLEHYHLWHATRGELLRRLGETDRAAAAFQAAAELTDNPAEQAHLRRKQAAGSPE